MSQIVYVYVDVSVCQKEENLVRIETTLGSKKSEE